MSADETNKQPDPWAGQMVPAQSYAAAVSSLGAAPGSRPSLHAISLGAGVQSSTMALMAACGELTPMPECAIFADTGDEPQSVYAWLDWLEKQLPYPVYRVTAGVLSEAATRYRLSKKSGKSYLKPALPVFYAPAASGLGIRQCTMNHKIVPIRKKLREIRDGREVVQWIGISLDEIIRMKPSRDAWCEHIWPLVDKRMNRHDCLRWMKARGFPVPPRSACVYCPYHSDSEWRRLKAEEPQEFQRAVEFEARLQNAASKATALRAVPYLHRTCVPLATVDLSTDSDNGQTLLWGNECEGMCGV